ncbi:MAG: nucleotidyltransferase family protein [Gammaproteobacteria bacterium]|nr:nucleotidyltransferase family protein [Gammaproteobacteria bacterium]
MRAMILAAGRGERMGELTRDVPKPLLRVGDRYLIEYSLESLAKVGVQDVVINVCYRGDQVKAALGNGERYGLNIQYSEEKEALETGGGVYQALPLLGNDPFIVLSCDVITAYDLQRLPKDPSFLAHLVLVNNPDFHPKGDFCLLGHRVYLGVESTLTFANIGVYRPELFAHCRPGRFRLGELLKHEIANQKITGEHYVGPWYNMGTPKDLLSFTDPMNRT